MVEVVNGYPCKNCTDVEYAKKNIDPAHPKDGPNGADAKDPAATDRAAVRGPAVVLGPRSTDSTAPTADTQRVPPPTTDVVQAQAQRTGYGAAVNLTV